MMTSFDGRCVPTDRLGPLSRVSSPWVECLPIGSALRFSSEPDLRSNHTFCTFKQVKP